MNRLKRWTALAVAIAAIAALAAPAMASASAGMEQEGKALPVSAPLTFTSASPRLALTKWGTAICQSSTIEGELRANGEKSTGSTTFPYFRAVSYPNGFKFAGCSIGPNQVKVETAQIYNMSVSGLDYGTVEATLVLKLGTGFTCNYTATAAPFTIDPATSRIRFNESLFTGQLGCGNLRLDASFAVSYQGKAVTLN